MHTALYPRIGKDRLHAYMLQIRLKMSFPLFCMELGEEKYGTDVKIIQF